MEIMNEPSKKVKALIADDEEAILVLFGEVVRSMGITPVSAGDGVAAFQLFNEENPDIVISDIHMPKMDGIGLLRKIKLINPNIPVILITGYGHYRQLIESGEVKPDGYLEKPFNLQDIFDIIYKFLPDLKK